MVQAKAMVAYFRFNQTELVIEFEPTWLKA